MLIGVLYLANYSAGKQQQKLATPTPTPAATTDRGVTASPLPPIPIPAAPPSPAESRYSIDWLKLAPVSLPLVIFLIWLVSGWLRRRAMLRRLTVAGNPQLNRIRLKGAEELLFQGQAFRRALQGMRRHREFATDELNIDETVNSTIRKGGLFTPQTASRKVSPEYLYLIDRLSPMDEQARFGEELSRRIETAGVFIDRYYFQEDPLTCRKRDPLSEPITLSELSSRHPDHQLIIFGDGSGFLSSTTGEPERWLESFQRWPRRALLTPGLMLDYREEALAAKDIDILPANDIGLTLINQTENENLKIPEGNTPGPFPKLIIDRPRRWIERHEPRPEILEQLIEQLQLYLDAGGWLWLRACAVYPLLTWEITLYLGVNLLDKSEDFEARLLSLVRLPWFRHGFMPDWLRLRLIESFTPEQEQAVRRVVESMLSEICDTGEIQIEVAEPAPFDTKGLLGRLKNKTNSFRRRQKVGDLIKVQPEDSLMRDVVFVSFLSGRRYKRLSVNIPDTLRSLIFNRRRPTRERQAPGISIRPVFEINRVGFEMIPLKGGEFMMGGNKYDREKPIHQVRVSRFEIGKYEVTQAQWKTVMDNNPSSFKGDDLPVENVSWDDVQEFIQRLNQKTGM